MIAIKSVKNQDIDAQSALQEEHMVVHARITQACTIGLHTKELIVLI